MNIGYKTKIKAGFEITKPVQYAVDALGRDIRKTCLESDVLCDDISLYKAAEVRKECFVIEISNDNNLVVSASDDLGIIYGLYYISKTFLGVNEFWFWNEQVIISEEQHIVPDGFYYESLHFMVGFRGWFINDEVLFDGWKPVVDGETDESFPWKMAFEALLRCGGNMTIPGTDHNSHKYKKLASDYGLWITHHHAEPLGARMFARVYPDLEASFNKYPDLFRGLWNEGIEDQKDCKVIWNLGFRGQGDRPFWADDPTYDTPATRGKLISEIILEQYELVRKAVPDAVCCTNLYGEIMELYKEGFLTIPGDVIKIWADNGFGKMVSRRQNNHNPRVPSLPAMEDDSAHGIYYHASFYDLQAAAMMTMLPNSSEFVVKELKKVYEHNADDFWIINCSNVKPHTYYLDLIAKLWKEGDADDHLYEYIQSYYRSKNNSEIEKAYKLWPHYCIQYGPNEDDHAGEQFSNHGSRMLACGFMREYRMNEPGRARSLKELEWAYKAQTLADQVDWFMTKYDKALHGYKEYLELCDSVKNKLEAEGDRKTAHIFDNNLVCQVQYHYYSYLGAAHICRALKCCLCVGKVNDKYIKSFYEAGLAAEAFMKGYEVMRSHEHGIWAGFYENDCEADIRQSYYVAKSLMSYLRVLGDGPHFYEWQRKFQQDAGGDKVLLILRLKAHLTDDEIWELMDQSKKLCNRDATYNGSGFGGC